ncbi:MAG: glycosyltransferase [Fibrobacter sp.]|nr:glycosyltransferase [Fibrobacter sp.]
MATIFEINTCNVGSTGGIMLQIARTARNHGIRVITCCPDSRTNRPQKDELTYFIGSRLSHLIHSLFAKISGLSGILSFFATKFLIRKMKKEKCNLIHLHNVHGNYLNLPLLFRFIKRNDIPVVWTLHDCWSFTGRCPYFELIKCDKWKKGCGCCQYPSCSYPSSKMDSTKKMWNLKKKWFTGIENCTIVTPSQWLADLVKQSYLKNYPVKVIHNGINLSVFKPSQSNFKGKYNILEKKIILGVAFEWEKRKGLDVFIDLAKRLSKDYQIILVGTNDSVDALLPSNIISIHRTQNQKELAEIYTAADVFVNPTREEVLGLVNIESLACGTPVITFKTGGSPECIDNSCGFVVKQNDVDSLVRKIVQICEKKNFTTELCRKKACSFDMNVINEQYVDLYRLQLEL